MRMNRLFEEVNGWLMAALFKAVDRPDIIRPFDLAGFGIPLPDTGVRRLKRQRKLCLKIVQILLDLLSFADVNADRHHAGLAIDHDPLRAAHHPHLVGSAMRANLHLAVIFLAGFQRLAKFFLQRGHILLIEKPGSCDAAAIRLDVEEHLLSITIRGDQLQISIENGRRTGNGVEQRVAQLPFGAELPFSSFLFGNILNRNENAGDCARCGENRAHRDLPDVGVVIEHDASARLDHRRAFCFEVSGKQWHPEIVNDQVVDIGAETRFRRFAETRGEHGIDGQNQAIRLHDERRVRKRFDKGEYARRFDFRRQMVSGSGFRHRK